MKPRASFLAPDTLPPPPHWSASAACKEAGSTEVFYPGSANAGVNSSYAKTFCARCPVQPECLTHALTKREEYGVWGGLDELERRALFRDARRAARDRLAQETQADASAPA